MYRKECETEDGYGICPSCIHYTRILCPICRGGGDTCPYCNGGYTYGCEMGLDIETKNDALEEQRASRVLDMQIEDAMGVYDTNEDDDYDEYPDE